MRLRRQPKPKPTFEERYATFIRRERWVLGLFLLAATLSALAGAFFYSAGVLVGFAFGYCVMRSRHHMEVAKLHMEQAATLTELDGQVRHAVGVVVAQAFEHGRRIANSEQN